MDSVLLDQVLGTVGEASADGAVELVGADPVLPTPLRIGEAGAATIAACGLQAARLWELRTGRRQYVRVDVDAAAAAMRSGRYARLETATPNAANDAEEPGIYRTRDEHWVYLHRRFPHHRERIRALLKCDDDDSAFGDAARGWEARALEEAVVKAGACAAVVRTADEWRRHEQAQTLATLPLMEVLRLGESPPELHVGDGNRPLSGVHVLDLTRVLAGPTCARTLAEHGAEVLRVGTPNLPDNPTMMRDTGHGKRSTALDLTTADARAVLNALVDGADVFSQGYRPGAIAALGFSVDELIARRPGLICVSLSAFSHRGPWSARRGFDTIVQAVSGIADEHATDGKPRFAPANPLDYLTGYLAAFGVMVALGRRAREGGSYLVRLSLAQTGCWLASLPRVDPSTAAPELPRERLESLMMWSETPFGRLRHLAPIAQLSETPGRWERPSVPLDHDPPTWL